jgi:hypothetical protein
MDFRVRNAERNPAEEAANQKISTIFSTASNCAPQFVV